MIPAVGPKANRSMARGADTVSWISAIALPSHMGNAGLEVIHYWTASQLWLSPAL